MRECPCHSHLPYVDCCKPYHDGQPAPNALALMRSRYSAYALNLPRYIMETTYPASVVCEQSIVSFSTTTQFLGLDTLEFVDGKERGIVEFVAHLRRAGKDLPMRERSLFEKIDGRWYYLSK